MDSMNISVKSESDSDSDNSVEDKSFYNEIEMSSCSDLQNTNSVLISGSSEAESVRAVPLLLNGKYFSIIKRISESEHQKSAGGIIAACQFCNDEKPMKGSVRVTSNFLQHLKLKHKIKYEEYLLEKKQNKRQRNKNGTNKQSTTFDGKILKFVVDTFSPLSIVENSSFKDLFEGSDHKVPNQRTIIRLLDNKYSLFVSTVKEEILKTANYVCTTVDVWSGGKRSFFGYTCHWITESFQRRSAALACRKYASTHSFDRIADVIDCLNNQFNLKEEKIICTITDNGSNFVKAFKEFGVKKSYQDEDDSESEEEDLSMETISPSLPKHFRSVSHTLNLLATTDFNNFVKENELSYGRHKRALARCASIWNKCNRPETAEIIQKVLSNTLETPVATRWNSLYDSIKNLLEHKIKLTELCVNLNVENFSFSEIVYLEEYCILMEPIAEGIDFLQKEENNFFGYFLPSIITIKVKLERLLYSGRLNYLSTVAKRMTNGLINRFDHFFKVTYECHDAIVAAITCPAIKEKFLPALRETAPHVSEEFVHSILIKSIDSYYTDDDQAHKIQEMPAFFDFGYKVEEKTPQTDPTGIRKELNLYLNDEDISINSLNRYPRIKKIFMKFNTPLPSSAPVERLFSFAAIVNCQRYQKLTDNHFEKLVILSSNKKV